MLCTMMAVTALGCGGKKNDTAEGTEAAESVNGTETAEGTETVEYESPSYDLDPSDYVTLCDYSKVPVRSQAIMMWMTRMQKIILSRCFLITDRSTLQMIPNNRWRW